MDAFENQQRVVKELMRTVRDLSRQNKELSERAARVEEQVNATLTLMNGMIADKVRLAIHDELEKELDRALERHRNNNGNGPPTLS